MNKTFALVLPAQGRPYKVSVTAPEGDFIRQTVGGHFDCVRDRAGRSHAYCHDEGLLLGLPINPIATAFFGRIIAGDVVVFGSLNAEGVADGYEYSVSTTTLLEMSRHIDACIIWADAYEVAQAVAKYEGSLK